MFDLSSIFSNYVLNVALLSWVVAQIIKTIIHLLFKKQFKAERLIGAGGMPSAHSATVCALCVAIARTEGFSSPIFAIAVVLAAIVMYDATGVRRAAGEQAKVLNKIVEKHKQDNEYIENHFEKALKEFLGHTPIEVISGAILGVIISFIIPI